MISSINLHNFRNYKSVSVNFNSNVVILYGPNGSGKTNLLEAISLFSSGRGLRGSAIQEITNTFTQPNEKWAVNLFLDNEISLSTGLSFTSNNRPRRICKIQGDFVKSSTNFHEYISLISITPLMDHLFVDSASARRKFMDDLVCSYFPQHSINLLDYEKSMKQRLSILKNDNIPDAKWLSSLEEIMSEKNILVCNARKNFIQLLDDGQKNQIPLFPKIKSKMIGKIENCSKDEILNMLRNSREIDKISGMTTVGCHRSDWIVSHLSNERIAKDCSTGEQKIILISIILSFINQRLKKCDIQLVLLLDDVIARLDFSHRMVLFEQVKEIVCNSNGVQVFFSGTDLELFEPIQSAQFLHVENATIVDLNRGLK